MINLKFLRRYFCIKKYVLKRLNKHIKRNDNHNIDFLINVKLKKFISKVLDVKLDSIDFKVMNTNLSKTNSSFFVVSIDGKDKLFVKVLKESSTKLDINNFLNKVTQNVPTFYGLIRYKGLTASVFEYIIDGNVVKNINQLKQFEIIDLASAIAKTDLDVSRNLNSCMYCVNEVSWFVSKRLLLKNLITNMGVELDNLDFFINHEQLVLNNYDNLKHDYPVTINNNDLRLNNIMVTKEKVYLIDWDHVSIGFCGFHLRTFAKSKIAIDISKYYYELVSKYYPQVTHENILFIMFISDIYWALHNGINNNDLKKIQYGLNLFRDNYDILCFQSKVDLLDIDIIETKKTIVERREKI